MLSQLWFSQRKNLSQEFRCKLLIKKFSQENPGNGNGKRMQEKTTNDLTKPRIHNYQDGKTQVNIPRFN